MRLSMVIIVAALMSFSGVALVSAQDAPQGQFPVPVPDGVKPEHHKKSMKAAYDHLWDCTDYCGKQYSGEGRCIMCFGGTFLCVKSDHGITNKSACDNKIDQ